MEFTEMLKIRESCRAYRDKPVTREQLLNIAEAGRLSPSGCNAQPWHFLLVEDAEAKKQLCEALLLPNGGTACPWRESVPAFLVLVETPAKIMPLALEYYGDTQRFAEGDIGMAAMNMCYAALAQGLSTCVVGLYDHPKMHRFFGIPEENDIRLVLAVGYSAEPNSPRPKIRKPLTEVCSFNHW